MKPRHKSNNRAINIGTEVWVEDPCILALVEVGAIQPENLAGVVKGFSDNGCVIVSFIVGGKTSTYPKEWVHYLD